MPKVAIVANYAFTTWNFRRNVLEALAAQHIDTEVIAPFDETVPLLQKLERVHCSPLKWLHPKSLAPLRDILLTLELVRTFKRLQPDLVVLYTIKPNLFANIAARHLGVPTISVVTGLGYTFLHSSWLRWGASKLYKFAFSKTRAAVFHNQVDSDLFVAARLIPSLKCKVIEGSGVNMKHFAFTPLPQNPSFTFLMAARLVRDKGIAEYIAAATKLKRSHPMAICRVIGDWHRINPAVMDKQRFDEAVANGIIDYGGALADVRPSFAAANCIVLPSYREGLSKTLLEALSMGRPIITTQTPGCQELVPQSTTGRLVPIKDAEALYLAMVEMIELPHKEQVAMAEAGNVLIATSYADEVILRKYMQLITDNLKAT